jgi:hypothetical protein
MLILRSVSVEHLCRLVVHIQVLFLFIDKTNWDQFVLGLEVLKVRFLFFVIIHALIASKHDLTVRFEKHLTTFSFLDTLIEGLVKET